MLQLQLLNILISFLIGIFIGLIINYLKNKGKKFKYEKELNIIENQLFIAKEKINQQKILQQEHEKLKQEIYLLNIENNKKEIKFRELTVRLEEMQRYSKDKKFILENNDKYLSLQFENLANRIFEESGNRTNEQNKKSLYEILQPLRDQLDGFKHQVQESFIVETKERHTLIHEIQNLQQINNKISQDAINLTKALKGDNKIQGNWGEIILSNVLESSGLRKGYEYDTQIKIKTENNNFLQPDVIVNLPHGKKVIIDAKISLLGYERFFNSDKDSVRNLALKEHLSSIRTHIRILGNKNYQQILGLNTLDYILMFIPIEPAFITTINKDPEILNDALRQNIMLVSPTTLLVALRTINNLWHYEHQSVNTKKIADKAAKLYDKIRLFIEDMELLGHNLEKSHISYQNAMNKFINGKGNLIKQAENFRTLGVIVKKPITINHSILE